MSTGTRRASFSRYPSVRLEKQSSVISHNSDAVFDEHDETSTASLNRTSDGEQVGIWNTTRRKLTLISLCLVYFAATASFAILSPFFPGEVSFNITISLEMPAKLAFPSKIKFLQSKLL